MIEILSKFSAILKASVIPLGILTVGSIKLDIKGKGKKKAMEEEDAPGDNFPNIAIRRGSRRVNKAWDNY